MWSYLQISCPNHFRSLPEFSRFTYDLYSFPVISSGLFRIVHLILYPNICFSMVISHVCRNDVILVNFVPFPANIIVFRARKCHCLCHWAGHTRSGWWLVQGVLPDGQTGLMSRCSPRAICAEIWSPESSLIDAGKKSCTYYIISCDFCLPMRFRKRFFCLYWLQQGAILKFARYQ